MSTQKIEAMTVESFSMDPWHNLAIEEYLLRNIGSNQAVLYLWQNKDTVVIGRNQNPWKECRCRELEKDGGKLARRLSGGGAVFHDAGNLNFTFVVDRSLYDLEKQLRVILDAVRSLGIEAEFTGRNDLTAYGRKFSGNAFYFSGKGAYHHGTILINGDMTKLQAYLQVSKEKIVSKGIESVRSRVINLKELKPELSIEQMKNSLKESFNHLYGHGEIVEIPAPSEGVLQPLYDKYSSWEWRYGDTPKFDILLEQRFTWGGLELGLSLRGGLIEQVVIYSDAMDTSFVENLEGVLHGLPFDFDSMATALDQLESQYGSPSMVQDVKKWLKEKIESI